MLRERHSKSESTSGYAYGSDKRLLGVWKWSRAALILAVLLIGLANAGGVEAAVIPAGKSGSNNLLEASARSARSECQSLLSLYLRNCVVSSSSLAFCRVLYTLQQSVCELEQTE